MRGFGKEVVVVNETLKVIASRRSRRRYKGEQISDAELRQVMEAAIYAPSARNQQKWHFTVIQDKDLIDKMAQIIQHNAMNAGNEHLAKLMGAPGYHVFHHAPTVVIISYVAGESFVEMDCGMAAQNICLAAESLGLGSCVIGFSRFLLLSQEGKELLQGLGIPEGYSHLCGISLGYTDAKPLPMPRRNKDVVTYIK